MFRMFFSFVAVATNLVVVSGLSLQPGARFKPSHAKVKWRRACGRGSRAVTPKVSQKRVQKISELRREFRNLLRMRSENFSKSTPPIAERPSIAEVSNEQSCQRFSIHIPMWLRMVLVSSFAAIWVIVGLSIPSEAKKFFDLYYRVGLIELFIMIFCVLHRVTKDAIYERVLSLQKDAASIYGCVLFLIHSFTFQSACFAELFEAFKQRSNPSTSFENFENMENNFSSFKLNVFGNILAGFEDGKKRMQDFLQIWRILSREGYQGSCQAENKNTDEDLEGQSPKVFVSSEFEGLGYSAKISSSKKRPQVGRKAKKTTTRKNDNRQRGRKHFLDGFSKDQIRTAGEKAEENYKLQQKQQSDLRNRIVADAKYYQILVMMFVVFALTEFLPVGVDSNLLIAFGVGLVMSFFALHFIVVKVPPTNE